MRMRFDPTFIMGPVYYEYKLNSLFGFLISALFARRKVNFYADNFGIALDPNASCSTE